MVKSGFITIPEMWGLERGSKGFWALFSLNFGKGEAWAYLGQLL